MIGAIIVKISENQLLRILTMRFYCQNEFLAKVAMGYSISLLENAKKFNVFEYNEPVNDYDKEKFSNLPFHVAFSLIYKKEEDKAKFIEYAKKILQNYNNS